MAINTGNYTPKPFRISAEKMTGFDLQGLSLETILLGETNDFLRTINDYLLARSWCHTIIEQGID